MLCGPHRIGLYCGCVSKVFSTSTPHRITVPNPKSTATCTPSHNQIDIATPPLRRLVPHCNALVNRVANTHYRATNAVVDGPLFRRFRGMNVVWLPLASGSISHRRTGDSRHRRTWLGSPSVPIRSSDWNHSNQCLAANFSASNCTRRGDESPITAVPTALDGS